MTEDDKMENKSEILCIFSIPGFEACEKCTDPCPYNYESSKEK